MGNPIDCDCNCGGGPGDGDGGTNPGGPDGPGPNDPPGDPEGPGGPDGPGNPPTPPDPCDDAVLSINLVFNGMHEEGTSGQPFHETNPGGYLPLNRGFSEWAADTVTPPDAEPPVDGYYHDYENDDRVLPGFLPGTGVVVDPELRYGSVTIGLSGISAPPGGVTFSLDSPAGVGLWIRYDADVSDGTFDPEWQRVDGQSLKAGGGIRPWSYDLVYEGEDVGLDRTVTAGVDLGHICPDLAAQDSVPVHVIDVSADADADNDAAFDEDGDAFTLRDQYIEWVTQRFFAVNHPGKLSTLNDGDLDWGHGDTFPDFADGFDWFPEDPRDDLMLDGVDPALKQFVPTLPAVGSLHQGHVKFWFEYDAADPHYGSDLAPGQDPDEGLIDPYDMRHWYDNAAERHHYILGPEGSARLWLRPAHEARAWQSITDNGDYIDSTEPATPGGAQEPVYFTHSDFGLDPAVGGEVMLYVESVRPSTTVGGGEIKLHVTYEQVDSQSVVYEQYGFSMVQIVPVTAVGSRFVKLKPDGTTTPTDDLAVSYPAPAFSNLQVTLVGGSLDTSNGATQLVGDLTIQGSLDDPISDLYADGIIDRLELFLNGATEAYTTITIPGSNIQKGGASADPLKPFDFSATFNATLADVPLQPGWNHIRLRAINPDGFVGYADASVEVLAEPIVDVRLDLEDYDLYQNSLAGVWAQFRRGDGVWSAPELLNWQNAGGSFEDHIYVSDDGDTVVDFLGAPVLDPQAPDTFTGIVSKGSVGADAQAIVFTEGGNDPPYAQGSGVFDDFELTDYSQHRLSIGNQVITDFSTGGSMEAYLLELLAPPALEQYISRIEAFGDGDLWDVVIYNDRLFLGDLDINELAPAAFWTTISFPQAFPPNVTPPDDTGTFAKGFADGLQAPLIELKDAAKHAAEWAWEEMWDGRDLVAKVSIWLAMNADEAAAAGAGAWQVANDLMAPGPGLILADLALDPAGTVTQLLSNSHPVQGTLPPEINAIFEIGGELLRAVADEVQDLQHNPYQQGWYLGYATTTIAIEVLGTVATAGVGKLATLVRLAPKFYTAGGRFAHAMNRIGIDTNGTIIDDPLRLAKGLHTTAMCFVAGTLIHTIDGLVPIEFIREGDLVWSRDEFSGQWGYRPVTHTVTTRPDALYHVSYDPDGTGPLPAETLSTTAPHPFWVADIDGFLAASELEVGHELVLADGSAAWVTDLRIEHAPADDRFTTYNFAVTDFATYFAGESGVWVHNESAFDCEQFFSHVDWMRKKDNTTLRSGFEKVLELSDPDRYPQGSAARSTAEKLAAKYDPHLATAAREVMHDAYARATAGAGVDLTEVPSVRELYLALSYEYEPKWPGGPWFWRDGRAGASELEVHHTASKKVARRLLGDAGVAVSDNLLDDMPGFLINKLSTRPEAGPAHQQLTNAINAIDLGPPANPRPIGQVFSEMAAAYQAWDPVLGPKVWAVAQAWFDVHGVRP